MRELLVLLLATVPLLSQHGSSSAVNPYTGPGDVAIGATVYRGQCAGCHGHDGSGSGAGPTLKTGMFRYGRGDEDLFLTLTKGVPGTSMPAFALGGQRTWQVITFLRTLSFSTSAGKGTGDSARGVRIFATACAGCHRVNGEGGVSGPDLSGVAARQSETDLRDSLERPDAIVESVYWSVTGQTASGSTVQGIRLNEDTHSIQIRDPQGRLVSLRKQDMAELQLVRRSPMPSFDGKLTKQETDDVIAFLISVAARGERR